MSLFANKITGSHATTRDRAHTFFVFTSLSGNFPYSNYEVRVEKPGLGFYPAASSSAASVIKSDYNALYRVVVAVSSHGSYTVTDANFIAMQAGDRRILLARTGQSTSYSSGNDAAAAKGVAWPSTRFADNSDGSVTDALTGLVWLKDAGCFNAVNWANALSAANQLASGSCGLSDGSHAGDWRMPG